MYLCQRFHVGRNLWPAIIGNVLIIAGVWGELWFLKRARSADDSRVAEAERGLEAALLRAVSAEEELIRLRTPRSRLISGRETEIPEKLRPFKNVVFDTAVGPNDKEVEDFLWNLEPILWNADWKQVDWIYGRPGRVSVSRNDPERRLVGAMLPAFNISIQIHDPANSPALVEAANALVSALAEIGIDAELHGFNIHNATPSAMHILVCPKR